MVEGYHRNKTASPDRYQLLKEFAKENRNNMTEAERLLWNYLKVRRNGVSFRRQHIIGDYICDFVCLKKKLIIEVDGGYHNELQQMEDDALRQNWLERQGYEVVRFTNEEIYFKLEDTLKVINNKIATRSE